MGVDRYRKCSCIFSDFVKEEHLDRVIRFSTYERGETLFQQGELVFGAYLIRQGKVWVRAYASSRSRTLEVALPGGQPQMFLVGVSTGSTIATATQRMRTTAATSRQTE